MTFSERAEFERLVRKVVEYFSRVKFLDKTAETERLELIQDAETALKGGPTTGFHLWKHFQNLSEMKLPADVTAEILNFRQFFHGTF